MQKTIVYFLKNGMDVYAYFPLLNYDKRRYGCTKKIAYSHIGQHSAVSTDYARESFPASRSEYLPLVTELSSLGYSLFDSTFRKKYFRKGIVITKLSCLHLR